MTYKAFIKVTTPRMMLFQFSFKSNILNKLLKMFKKKRSALTGE